MACEKADAAAGLIAVAAKMQFGGVRADHGDALVLAFGERQQVAFVFQEDDGFVRGFQRERLVLGAVCDFFGVVGVRIRIFEHVRPWNFARSNAVTERSIADSEILRISLDRRACRMSGSKGSSIVDAGFECHLSRLLLWFATMWWTVRVRAVPK